MSAESEMAAILSHASNNALSLTGSAQTLVDSAIEVIQESVVLPTPPFMVQSHGIINFDTGLPLPYGLIVDETWRRFTPPALPEKPGLPPFPTITLPDFPDLVEVEAVNARFDEELEALRFPTFQYASPGNAPSFNAVLPELDSSVSLEAPPDTSLPGVPALLPFTPLPAVSLTIPSMPQYAGSDVTLDFDPNFFTDQFGKFSASIFGGSPGVRGLDELISELSAMSSQALGPILTDLIDKMGQQLTDRYQSGLASVETTLQQGLDAALQEEADRVRVAMQDRSGWDLPALVQQALTATMEQSISAWQAQARSQQTTDQWEHAQSVFETSATLYEKLRRTIQELKTQELERVLEAHRQAIRYAQQVTDALLTAFTVENYQKYDLEFKTAESRLKRYEAELEVRLLEHEVVFAQLEAEKAKQDQDGLWVQQYQAQLQQLEMENKVLASQVATARAELELINLPVELYEAQIRAFGARVNAYEAQVGAVIAQIDGNAVRVEAELAKVKGFEAEAEGYMAQVSAHRTLVQSQKQRNDSVLEELRAKVKAALAPIEVATSRAKYALASYEAEAKDFLADAKIALEKAKLDEEWRSHEQKGLFDAYRMTREQAISLAGKRLEILDSLAKANETGAGVLAQMAGGAMSAANGIAGVIFKEA